MTPLSAEERARLRSLAEKATPGPWYDKDDPGASCEECGESLPLLGGVVFSSVTSGGVAIIDGGGFAAADRAYIAAASPDVILQLVARVRELERERDEARALYRECEAGYQGNVEANLRADNAERERDVFIAKVNEIHAAADVNALQEEARRRDAKWGESVYKVVPMLLRERDELAAALRDLWTVIHAHAEGRVIGMDNEVVAVIPADEWDRIGYIDAALAKIGSNDA